MNRFALRAADFRPGDVLVLVITLALIASLWANRGARGDGVVVRRGGDIFLEADLRLNRLIRVPGPLGDTLVEIRAGQVRVLSDPSPRQLCVRQGWLAPGDSAICLPNQVSVERGHSGYDSINY